MCQGGPRSEKSTFSGTLSGLIVVASRSTPWPLRPFPSSTSGPILAGEPGALDRTAKELRVALTEIGFYFIVNHGVPREKIHGDLRRGEALPRPAGREEARPQDRPAQHRLHADARQYAAHLDGAGRHQAQPQRGLLREARDGGRPSRRLGQPPLPRPQPLARGPARLPRDRGRLLQHHGSAGAQDGAASTPARSTCRPSISTRRSGTASTRCA